MITERVFINHLKAITTALSDEWLLDMTEYALMQARNGNWAPLNATASVMSRANWGSRFAEAMYAIGLFALVKREPIETPEEWRGIALLYRLVPREKAKCPETGAVLENTLAVQAAIKALLLGLDRAVIAEKISVYREAQTKAAEAKAAELAKRRGSVSFWIEKIERVLKDAEKSRVPTGPILDKIFERYRAPLVKTEE